MGGRFSVLEAEGPLGLVQNLLNTAALPKNPQSSPDLLDAPDTAAAWLASVGTPADRPGLRDLQTLRDALRRALIQRDHDTTEGSEPDAGIAVPVRAILAGDGTVSLAPEREGGADLRARVLLAVHAAQLAGTWSRLKVCRNPECRVAFWDSSRNTSAVWHDARTCGNIANLRNSRARRQQVRQTGP
ncbi:CGNR zinc finger domain-containing protein [Streptomyces sp. NPDC006923]|uniref:CGNR zinc finger domain-containing protein n=1 Tax=Streptomyces sp. NPDC006923 TaxID=3155355 RepID=UPI0033C41AA5